MRFDLNRAQCASPRVRHSRCTLLPRTREEDAVSIDAAIAMRATFAEGSRVALFDAPAVLLTGGWQQAGCSANWPRTACHEGFYEASGSADLMRLRSMMQRRENGALIERMGDTGIELHINTDRGPRECPG